MGIAWVVQYSYSTKASAEIFLKKSLSLRNDARYTDRAPEPH
ncbi:hypothetical protein SBA6_660008 [Candidatus Sulfopaludibacter sp. SbA6]|nr:hypothetical protein SBA6_660008 [Candidatus Sulfopaludibacter sp. SbA6]